MADGGSGTILNSLELTLEIAGEFIFVPGGRRFV